MNIFTNLLPATKRDLADTERRILDAIELDGQDRARLDALVRRAEKTAKRVEKLAKSLKALDAQT